MRNPTGIALFCVSALVAGTWTNAAEAKRVFYTVDGHRYWYNSAKHSGPPVKRGRSKSVAESAGRGGEKAKPTGSVAMRTDTAAPASTAPVAPRLAETRSSVEAPSPRLRGLSRRALRRAARLEAKQNARRRVVEARASSIAAKAAAKQVPVAAAVTPASLQVVSTAESPTTTPVKAVESPPSALSSNVVPPPPGPVLINTVTYDFGRGVKTTSLRDGAIFVESFDPQAFFRIVPEPGPNATSSIASPALADVRRP